MSLRALLVLSPLSLLLACGDKDEEPAGGGGDDCTERSWFLDADGDGHGGEETQMACEAPEGFVAQSTDCDDADAQVNPDADEVCDGADNNCDGTVDDDAVDLVSMYTDADGDGFGDPDGAVDVCPGSEGVVDDASDCDDSDDAIFPGGVEVCDGVDNDCDEVVDGLAVPGDHATIQEAVDAAVDGELVCLDAGTFTEDVLVDGKAVVIGGAGAGVTILEPTGSDERALGIVGGDGTEIMDLSIGGLSVSGTDGFTLERVGLEGATCEASSCTGPALYVSESTGDLVDVDVSDNSIEISSSGNAYVFGIVRAESSDLSWTGGEMAANIIEGWGSTVLGYGLVSFQSSTVRLADLHVHDNLIELTAEGGGSSVAINYQGMLYAGDADIELADVLFEANEIDTLSRQGDRLAPGSSGTVSAQSYGWMVTSGSSLTWEGGGFVDNVSTNQGISYSQAIAAQVNSEVVTLTDFDLIGNYASAKASTSTGSAACAGIWTNGGASALLRVDARDNEINCQSDATYNYGLFVHWNGATTYENVVLASNYLYSDGSFYAPISFNYQTATPDVRNITVVGTDASSIYGKSGVFHTDNSSGLTIVNAAVSNNFLTTSATSSDFMAAGVHMAANGGEPDVTYSNFIYNGNSGVSAFVTQSGDVSSTVMAMDGNISADPAYADTSGSPEEWDISPGSGSAMIDAGDPSISDVDGSTSDMGATGGPNATW